MNLRSQNRKDYFARLLFVVLFCLAAHCIIAYAQGGRGKQMFDLRDINRVRTLLLAGLVIGVAGFVTCPRRDETPAKTADDAAKPLPPAPASEPAAVAAPAAPVQTAAPSQPVVPAQPVVAVQPAAPVEPDRPSAPSEPSAPTAPEPATPPPAPKPAAPDKAPPTQADVPETEDTSSAANEMVERMWNAARNIEHNYIPDPVADSRYLGLVHGAAMSGHVKAQEKLSEYAYRRGAMVEEFYWLKLSQLNGNANIERRLSECSLRWMRKGCPPEYENTCRFFNERQSALGRAALRLDSGVQVDQAVARLKDMATEGEVAAVLLLEQHGYRVR